jgi:DHA1 family bicyclomycin/chloramphenicol resistance-like MFS transporter
MYLPSLPVIGQALAAPAAGVQLTLSAFLLGFAVGQFLYGPVSDTVGRRPVLLFGIGLFVVASVGCALAPSIGALVAARFVQALGASGPIVLARAIVRDLYEGPRAGRELSRMGSIMGLVPALAPIAGGALHAVFGWRANFWAQTLFALSLAAIVLLRLPETIPARLPGPVSLLGILRGFRALLAHPGYRVYVAMSSLAYAGLFSFISGSSFVLQGIYGLSEMAFALTFAFVVIGYISGTTAAQRLVGALGLDGTIRIGVAALAAGGLLMLALVALRIPSFLAIVLPMAVYTFGVGLTMPQAMASAMAPFPEGAGAASSLLGLCQMTLAALVGIGLGQMIGGASALPLPAFIAGAGLLAFAIFNASARVRAK